LSKIAAFLKKSGKKFPYNDAGRKNNSSQRCDEFIFHAHINLIFQSNRLSRENGFDL